MCFTHSSCSQLPVTDTDSCTAAFCTFLLSINFNTETTVMVTSLLLYHYHAVTALILKLNCRDGGVNFMSRPFYRRKWPRNLLSRILCVCVCVPELVCMFWGEGKVLTLSDTPLIVPPQSSRQTGHCGLWYWAKQGIWIDLTALIWDQKYNSDTEWIIIASFLNTLTEELFCI
jgi:hypothetical protein